MCFPSTQKLSWSPTFTSSASNPASVLQIRILDNNNLPAGCNDRTIFQFFTASLTETSFPDFICRRFDHRFTDTISYIWIPGIMARYADNASSPFTIICIFGTLRIISSRMFIVISISPYLSSWSRKRFVRSI